MTAPALENRAVTALWTRAFTYCFAANLLQALAFNLFLHFPGYLQGLGAGEAQIGLISSLTAVAAIALRPPIGRAMDRRGRRGVILLGGVLHTATIGLYLLVSSIGPLLYGIRILHGMAEAMLFSALFTYAADRVPAAQRTRGLAYFGVSGMLPISLGGVLGDVLLARWGYDALFATSLLFAAVSLLLSLPLRDTEREPGAPPPVTRGMLAVLAQPDLRPLWWIGTVFALGITAFFIFIKTYVEVTGLGSVSLFFTAYTISALAVRVFSGGLPDRVGPKRVLGPALLALAAGFVALALARGDLGVGAAGLLCGIGHGYTFPILFGMVVSRAPEADRGAAMAIFTALFDLGVLVGGPSFGWLIERSGYSWMFAAGAALILVGAGVFFLWDRRALAPAALLVGAVFALGGCQAPAWQAGDLAAQHAELGPGEAEALEALHPFALPWQGQLVLFTCRWTTDAPIGVYVSAGFDAEAAPAIQRALDAVGRAVPGVRFYPVREDEAQLRIAVRERDVERDAGPASGVTVADCAVDADTLSQPGPLAAELVDAQVELAATVGPDALGRERPATPAELAGAAAHELAHALGFSGHASGRGLLSNQPEALRALGTRLLAGEPLEAPALRALYALPSGTRLAQAPVDAWRTNLADRMAVLAERGALEGPFARVGDRTARVWWREPRRREEYGLQLVNLSEVRRRPERALWVPESRTRQALPRSLDAPQ